MSERFSRCTGVDISEAMVNQAREVNAGYPNCRFVVNSAADLKRFQAQTFNFVYSSLVLQHLPNEALARRYISEFLRVVRPGGMVVVQIPYRIPWRNRLQIRRRLYSLLRMLGFGSQFLYKRAGLNPIKMIAIPEQQVRRLVERHGGVIGLAQPQDEPGEPIRSLRYYVYLPDREYVREHCSGSYLQQSFMGQMILRSHLIYAAK